MDIGGLLIALAIIWIASKAAGIAMERIGQTAVLGELIAGVVIGPGVLGLVHGSEVLHALAELGVVILLFEVGLESDLSELLRAGIQASVVAIVGIVLPFAGGFALMTLLGHPTLVAVFVGAALTATSVGVTARVLTDLGKLQDPAARVVLGAAIVDDVLGLVILAVITGLAESGHVSAGGAALLTAKAALFLVAAIVVGVRLAPGLLRLVGRLEARGTLVVAAAVAAALLAWSAEAIGLAAIVGAFAAGLILATTERRAHIEERIRPIADLLVPIFFVGVGLRVEPALLNPFATGNQLGTALLITVTAVVTKLASMLAVYQRGVRRWPVGIGMVPRGEVGLIFAGIGLEAGVVSGSLYAAVVIAVMLTTFVAPPWLKALYRDARA